MILDKTIVVQQSNSMVYLSSIHTVTSGLPEKGDVGSYLILVLLVLGIPLYVYLISKVLLIIAVLYINLCMDKLL
jgi:hypothetical protein